MFLPFPPHLPLPYPHIGTRKQQTQIFITIDSSSNPSKDCLIPTTACVSAALATPHISLTCSSTRVQLHSTADQLHFHFLKTPNSTPPIDHTQIWTESTAHLRTGKQTRLRLPARNQVESLQSRQSLVEASTTSRSREESILGNLTSTVTSNPVLNMEGSSGLRYSDQVPILMPLAGP
jgi:hypothetical protein